MEYRDLENGLKVSVVGLGCEPLGGTDWGEVDEAELIAAARRAWDLGVTLFDTADAYGLGESEIRLGKALGANRHNAVIVTKFGVRWTKVPASRAKTWRDSSPSYMRRALEASLRRLKIDRIPIYLIHWPDPNTPIEETVMALEEQRLAGKIGIYGVSNFWDEDLSKISKIGLCKINEVPLNLIDRRVESELSGGHVKGMSFLAYGALAQGVLTGSYQRDSHFSEADRRHRLPQFKAEAWRTNEPVLDWVRITSAERGCSMSQVALRWVIEHPHVSAALVSAKNVVQLEDLLTATKWTFTSAEKQSVPLSQYHPERPPIQTERALGD